MVLVGVHPGIVCSAITLVIVWYVPVTEEMMKGVRAQLRMSGGGRDWRRRAETKIPG